MIRETEVHEHEKLISEIEELNLNNDSTRQQDETLKAGRYDLKFLMSFSNITSPAPELLPEIVRGYKHPEPVARNAPATVARTTARAPRDFSGKTLNFSTPSTKINNRVAGCATAPAVSRVSMARSDLDSVARALDLGDEKKERKVKPRETDLKRLQARRKQLDIGMNTDGYRAWLQQVPAEKRNSTGPRIPDVFQVCSKRSWDGQVRKWRRELHAYDPKGLPLPDHLAEEDSGELSQDE